MIAFDTDILTELFLGREPYATRASSIPFADRGIPVVVAEEILRGRFSQIRHAESYRGKPTLVEAYRFLFTTLSCLRGGVYLPFDNTSESLVATWKATKIRVGTNDMRIAATAIVANCTLVTRNARDFKQIPGLLLDVWT